MAQHRWCLALLAASLAGLLLADATLGQTFTYSRGWKPGGKRSRTAPLAPPPPPPPAAVRARTLAAAGAAQSGYLEELAAEDQQPQERFFVETLGDRWAPYDVQVWRPQSQDDGDKERASATDRFRHGERAAQGDHDDH